MNYGTFTNTFLRQASLLKDRGLVIDRDHMRSLYVKEKCLKLAHEYSSSDLSQIKDDIDLRFYVSQKIDKRFRLFTDSQGTIVIDHERTLLLYKLTQSINPDNPILRDILGLLYYVAGNQLHQEFENIISSSIKNFINPIFVLNPSRFAWKRCSYILRKYMLYLSSPEGYQTYYYEKPNLAQIAYLCSQGMPLTEADDFIYFQKRGIFYNNLDKDIENYLAHLILSGETPNLDGLYGKQVEEALEQADENHPLFTEKVKPIMVELTGMTMHAVLEELSHQHISPSEAYVYNLSPYRFGIAVKDSFDIKHALPESHSWFRPVVKPNLADLVLGAYL